MSKNLNEFYNRSYPKKGKETRCKKCMNSYNFQYCKRNRKKRNEQAREKYRTKYSEHLKYKYNITLDDYNSMFQNQAGCCAICNIHQNELNTKLHIDHCHNTNKIRGLLCSNCNTSLGLMKDDTFRLEKAIKYLLKNKSE
jgi:hypothetical protein